LLFKPIRIDVYNLLSIKDVVDAGWGFAGAQPQPVSTTL